MERTSLPWTLEGPDFAGRRLSRNRLRDTREMPRCRGSRIPRVSLPANCCRCRGLLSALRGGCVKGAQATWPATEAGRRREGCPRPPPAWPPETVASQGRVADTRKRVLARVPGYVPREKPRPCHFAGSPCGPVPLPATRAVSLRARRGVSPRSVFPAPSRPPGNVVWNTTGAKVLLRWDGVSATEHESPVTGYKVSPDPGPAGSWWDGPSEGRSAVPFCHLGAVQAARFSSTSDP